MGPVLQSLHRTSTPYVVVSIIVLTFTLCRRRTGEACVVCQEATSEAGVRMPCGHFYDISCILDFMQAATRDETLWPPRCCRYEIPLASIRRHMSTALLELYEEKSKEFKTLERVYCASPHCARFICAKSAWPPIFFSTTVTCPPPTCTTQTCSYCCRKISPMSRHVCSRERQYHTVLALADRHGWARCPGCKQLVERNQGCFHMTCRCKTQFCYHCNARWKTCDCPSADPERLAQAAAPRAAAQQERRTPQRQNHPDPPPRPDISNVRVVSTTPITPTSGQPAVLNPHWPRLSWRERRERDRDLAAQLMEAWPGTEPQLADEPSDVSSTGNMHAIASTSEDVMSSENDRVPASSFGAANTSSCTGASRVRAESRSVVL